MTKYVIFNADDFGASEGINRGIIEAHVNGVVSSTSFMVTGGAAKQAAELASDHPSLSVGLHWDVWGEDEREFDTRDLEASCQEFDRQLTSFVELFGRLPTHVDSHRHAHRSEHLFPVFIELTSELGVPLRGASELRYVGGFYGQWEWMVTNLEYIGVPFLEKLLRDEVRAEWTEISCHPGYASKDFASVYLAEREIELRTLTDPRVLECLNQQNIQLASYDDYNKAFAEKKTG